MLPHLHGLRLSSLSEADVVDKVFSGLRAGIGGQILTVNLSILRELRGNESLRDQLKDSLIVADGAPVLWASHLTNNPLKGRVTGASLVWSLSERAAAEGRRVFLLGGAPGVAKRASHEFSETYPGLKIVGTYAPPIGFDKSDAGLAACIDVLREAEPDIVFLALGHPKQETLALWLRPQLPNTWFLGCGGALTMAAADTPRAPSWMMPLGLEWLHRLGQEPRRLFRRYIVHDLPFAVRLLSSAVRWRLRQLKRE